MRYVFLLALFFAFTAIFYGQTSEPAKTLTAENFTMWLPSDSCKVCDLITIEGEKFRIIADDHIYLAFNPSYDGGNWVANIYIRNKSGKRFDFDPLKNVIVFGFKKENDFFEGKVVPEGFPAIDPVSIVKKMQNRTAWANALGAFGAGMQRQTVTVNTTSGTNTATSTVTVPDTQAQQRAQNQAAANNAKTANVSQSILDSALKANTIFPDNTVFGDVYMKRKKGFEVVDFRVTVNEKTYSFVYFLKTEKK